MPGNAPPVANEREALLGYLAQQRQVLKYTAYGLTDEQARLTPTAGTLSVGGLIRHVAVTERGWMEIVLGTNDGQDEEYMANFSLRPGEGLDDVFALYDRVAAETEATVAGLDLDHPVPVPRGAPWFPADVDAWSLRWVLLHLIEETARHAGHADMVRESIDGATAFALMAAAEGWPATEWLQPWTPSAA